MIAAAMNAAAGSLKGSPYDVALTPGSGGVLAWFESPGVNELVRHFKGAGATRDEIDEIAALVLERSFCWP
jgi:hypothetical protein